MKQPGPTAVLPASVAVAGNAAVVNGQVITNKDLVVETFKDGAQPTLNEMIDRILLEQAAKKYKVTVTAAEVNDKVDELKKRVVISLATRSPGLTWSKWLANQGRTEDYVRDSVRARILAEKLTAATLPPLTLKGQVHLYHILISTGSQYPGQKAQHTDAEAQALIAQIRSDIVSGKISFQDAAKKYSEDPGSATNGGDLGWISPTDYRLDPKFKDAAFNLKEHEISQPVQSSFGYHLILADRFGDNATPADLKALNDKQKDSRVQQGWQAFLENLRKSAVIKNYIVPGAQLGQ